MNRVIRKARDIDGYLTTDDIKLLSQMDELYAKAMENFKVLSHSVSVATYARETENIVTLYNEMGNLMQQICQHEDRINVYSFNTPQENHAEASRLIAKLRDVNTSRHEFVYYTQRAYELLFNLAYGGLKNANKNYLIVKTPVTYPFQNFAVHKIPNIDADIENTVMCVMLRGALLPSMIMSKEIQEYSSHGYVTPFALFKIKRDESRDEKSMEYILDLDRSYFKTEQLEGKDLVFADPMNATGGSFVTVIKYLYDLGVKPKSINFFTIISALKGALRIVRALDNVKLYTLWMDPVLNDIAYIMPGLGDAGDRINGKDESMYPRDIIQLIADYGSNIALLYRSQIRVIEETVLRR